MQQFVKRENCSFFSSPAIVAKLINPFKIQRPKEAVTKDKPSSIFIQIEKKRFLKFLLLDTYIMKLPLLVKQKVYWLGYDISFH